eukprot:6482375-Amphidinium_carterae.1
MGRGAPHPLRSKRGTPRAVRLVLSITRNVKSCQNRRGAPHPGPACCSCVATPAARSFAQRSQSARADDA